jgi:hypothetical protein
MCVAAALVNALGIEAEIPRWHLKWIRASGIAGIARAVGNAQIQTIF